MISHRFLVRILYSVLILAGVMITVGVVLILESKQQVYQDTETKVELAQSEGAQPFPVSVDPMNATISELDLLAFETDIDLSAATPIQERSFFEKILAVFSTQYWYQNLASPVSRVIVIWPGERKEEAAKNIGDILRWDEEDRKTFIELVTTSEPIISDGTFYPDQYVTHRYASPREIATLINTTFAERVLSRYTPEVAAQVPLDDALIIASLLEREASDFENMREISGVIWNRLFIDMPLQLDATLQYARGSRATESEWWPVPRPRDKFIDSAYNTYANSGLPPAPIANPSSAAVLAALNPLETECLFYFHGPDRSYYCSETYEEHTTKLRTAYRL